MTEATIYGDASDGMLTSSNATYATMLAGSGVSVVTNGTYGRAGQGTGYVGYEMGYAFDTSTLTASATVTAATLTIICYHDSSDYNPQDINVYLYDWGTTLEAADWRTPTQLGALTLVAKKTRTTAIADGATITFDDVALPANINKTGFTRFIVAMGQFASSTTPTTDDSFYLYLTDMGTTYRPYLTITYTVPSMKDPMGMSGYFGA